MELWREVEGFDGMLEVSDQGRFRSNLRFAGHVLKTTADKKGYQRLRYTLKRKKYILKLHREVAKAFIPNPLNLPQVNHIDGDKNNNAVSNLEWVTNRENARHAVAHGLWEKNFAKMRECNNLKKKAVIGISPDGGTRRFETVGEAERYLDSRHISDVLKGKRPHVKGWRFQYAGKEVMPDANDNDRRTECKAKGVSA